ncbi:MAG: hypothetical protein JNN05_07210 [Candidatus Omnitrophica bacterium]|nr:hypothetical protein [Candidatus Omnitrophota bacterium]
MIVVVIVGVIALFGIPNYQRTIDIAVAKDAVSNLKLIAAAQQRYLARNSSYYPSSATTVDVHSINDELKLNISQQQGVTYSCTNTAPQCSATRTGWTYSITLPTSLPVCTAGTCPYTPTY